MKSVIWIVIIVLLLTLAVVIGAIWASTSGDKICPGVSVGGTDVGGLTLDEAQARISDKLKATSAESITLQFGSETVYVHLAEIGARLDPSASASLALKIGRQGDEFQRILEAVRVHQNGLNLPPTYSFNKKTAARYIESHAGKFIRPPVNAKVEIQGEHVVIRPGSNGATLDPDEAVDAIQTAVNSGAQTVALPIIQGPPEITEKDLAGIDGMISTYSTPYKPWQRDRSLNLAIACRNLNGILIKPGAVFSYNKEVGPRLKKYGYRNAPIFVNGEVEDGLGGGVCQVCTTLYNAALLANLKIKIRSHHSRPVHYAPVGRDATVAYPYPDLKFQNNTGSPIYLTAQVGKSRVIMRIFGKRVPGREIGIVSANHMVLKPKVVQVSSNKLEPGKRVVQDKGLAGHKVSVYRIVKLNGEVVRRELISNDYYKAQDRVVAVSSKKPTPTAPGSNAPPTPTPGAPAVPVSQ